MAKLERSPSRSSPGGELAGERLIEAVLTPGTYPEGATFVGADEEHFAAVLAEAVAAQRPLVVVYPDGHDIVGEPHDGALAFRDRTPPPVIDGPT